MVRCTNGALYTGITLDIIRRIKQHNNGTGAKAVKALGRPVELAFSEECRDKSHALKREYHIKQLPKDKKENLCCNWGQGTLYTQGYDDEYEPENMGEFFWY